MRKPNEIDFWRGFALITIFVNHIPGNFVERFSYRNLSLSDSAELFVLLAGWSMRLAIENPKKPLTTAGVVHKLWGRAFQLYVAQTFITELAIFILAASSVWLDAPFLLDWHNVGAVFHQPIEAHIGLVLLTYQLGYFNILPLYVVLMIAAPIIAILYRALPAVVLPLSLGLYVLTLALGWNIPSWPIEGTWFFSPSAWQLVYVLGFLLAGKRTDLGAFARRHLLALRWIAVPILAAGVVVASTRYFPDLFDLPKPSLFVVFDKTFLSPDRLISVLALCALMAGAYAYLERWMPPVARFLSMLGRNSLNVFCAGSVLSLCGQIVRFIYGGSVVTDLVLFIVGVSLMAMVGWLTEWRTGSKAESAKAEPAPVPALPAPAATLDTRGSDARGSDVPASEAGGTRARDMTSGWLVPALCAALIVPFGAARADDDVPPVPHALPAPAKPAPQVTAPAVLAPATDAPALSPSCDAPAGVIAANAPLPNLAKALASHKTLEILAIGSASSAGLGSSSGVTSYPVQLETMLKVALKGVAVDVINRGTGGEVAQTSADRIRGEVAVTKPDLVLWQLGTNDALARVDPGQFTDIVKSTIDWLKENDIDVVLVGLQYTTRFARDESYFAIRQALDKIARDEKILYVKRYDAMKFIAQTRAKVHLMASDNYHLSDLGTQCMAEHVARAMIANLFVRRFRPGPPTIPARSN